LPLQNLKKKKHYVRYVSLSIRAGLHVGHPLGYIASDVYARYKDIKVLMYCTMGYDSFGLPAEQYAIQTGQRQKIRHQ
jgi:leucyl-tRNA synthetase